MIIQYLFSEPLIVLVWVVAIVYAITIHEFSHALAGKLEGDGTAESMGRLTLNPLSHIDPWGFLLLLFVGFGWGRPVPFNPIFLKHKRWGPALISLAGPLSNIVSLIVFGLIHKALLTTGQFDQNNYLIILLGLLIQINAILAIFNLIPIPPLDGSKLLFSSLPRTASSLKFQLTLERYGPFILIGFILLDSFNSTSVLGGLFQTLSELLGRLFG